MVLKVLEVLEVLAVLGVLEVVEVLGVLGVLGVLEVLLYGPEVVLFVKSNQFSALLSLVVGQSVAAR